MGRKALFGALCWLTLTQTFGDKRTRILAIQDNESAESAPRLYRNVPLGVYASAAPYGAYSFHLPTFAPAPRAAASQIVPVKENFVNHLTDSYGNKFVGAPQLTTYKIAFPQQFVSLQKTLPEHLAQPLVAASANFQFKQSNGQYFGAPYRVPALQGPIPTPLNSFPTFGQLYGENVKHLAPNTVINTHVFGVPNTHQQPTINKAVFTNTQGQEQYENLKNVPKFSHQKEPQIIIGKPKVQGIQTISPESHIQEGPQTSHGEVKFQRIQEAPHTHHVDAKFQTIQETPSTHKVEPNQQVSHSSHNEEKYEQVQELPHYEAKYQIIQERPQFQRIKEHHAPQGELKFQRIQETPTEQTQHSYEHSHEKPQHTRHEEKISNNKAKLQAAPAKQTVTYINDINGKKTVLELETKPLPLLDLTLLEPLTFDNPLVPQVQHFLPRINQATYQKLPEANIPSVKNYQKEYVVQKTTSYDSAEVHDKPQKDGSKKKHKKPAQPNKHQKKNDVPKKTSVTYHETLDDAPEIVYEINSPNYKETIKEKAVSYNKQTQSEPVHYSYGTKSDNEPVTYSYSRTTKEPVHIKTVEYHGNGPSHLIYNFKPEEHARDGKSHNSVSDYNNVQNEHESSHETHNDNPSYHHEQYNEQPQSPVEHREPSHKEKENSDYQKEGEQEQKVIYDSPPKYYSEPVQFKSENINFQPILKEYENNIRLLTTPSASIKVDPHQHVHLTTSSPQPHVNHRQEVSQPHHNHLEGHSQPHLNHHEGHSKTHINHHEGHSQPHVKHYEGHSQPHVNHHQGHSKPQVSHHEGHSQPHVNHYEGHAKPQINHQQEHSLPHVKHYEGNSHAHINHHEGHSKPHTNHHEENFQSQHQRPHSSPSLQHHPHSSPETQRHDYQSSPHSESYNRPAPHIHEKSKRIIIHDEAPDETHMLREQMRHEEVNQEENSEADFEKAYHDAALGFPAYNQKSSDAEKDIFDPESYGVPRDHVEYDFENTPFQQYQEEGDEFPKESRSSYKDARDKMMQNYYSDFSISKPESLLDRYQNKLGYYKLFKQQKPGYAVDDDDDKNQNQKSAKYTAIPYNFNSPQDKSKSYYGQAAPKQQAFEYDYANSAPRDNSAFASRPFQSKSRSSFVEPQFQYGFEPISLPKLLDSELAAMASNDSPESEKPGMRKKTYKENWYIKKTSTSAGAPAS